MNADQADTGNGAKLAYKEKFEATREKSECLRQCCGSGAFLPPGSGIEQWSDPG
jgi:hypothetical protein